MQQIMKSRLKTVYYYNPDAHDTEIHACGNGVAIISESLERLPVGLQEAKALDIADDKYVERYRRIAVDDFLDHMASCFEG